MRIVQSAAVFLMLCSASFAQGQMAEMMARSAGTAAQAAANAACDLTATPRPLDDYWATYQALCPGMTFEESLQAFGICVNIDDAVEAMQTADAAADTSLDAANAKIADGNAKLAIGDWSGATADFNAAIGLANSSIQSSYAGTGWWCVACGMISMFHAWLGLAP